ncbi:uncharacterized protein AC631_04788 [Debaryomyces fabryi]|uniref:Zn(2)-C6 fungal-type domain-containing protein n=1 Tax=Debaryomyces fabryi TaxID=58627 RepID=A0A0V1PT82_9ASCO|nr:uncharacterized protein AC631_04788 [Debaryomyces fabryi]KRZ99448.1 hypothetical protein AC631_04788 [Debaryomyces fabryi]CUM46513.1 unnamed protein product [Debaryomyces fabryi]
MDFYYRKLMGNGTVASKFKLNGNNTSSGTVIHLNQSNVREPLQKESVYETQTQGESADSTDSASMKAVEFPETHHSFNCDRCYKLKKKCLRLYPECENCTKAGASCAYIDRSNKRRKKTNQKVYDDRVNFETESPTFHIVNEKSDSSSRSKGKNDDLVVVHKLVTVSSLLSGEAANRAPDQFKEIQTRHKKPISRPGQSKDTPKEKTMSEILALKSLKQQQKTNLKEEFITMKAIKNELALCFVLNYFHNYGNMYPFINKEKFMENFKKIDFEREMIINLDVYLLMSVGCIIYDYNNDTSFFGEYFSEKAIESIIGILNFGGNNDEEEDFANLTLLMLLTIYAIKIFNVELCWGLNGIISRIIIALDFYKPQAKDENQQKRIFWSIFNLDSELNILLHKPSQLPNFKYIKLEIPSAETFTDDESGASIVKDIHLHKLQYRILDLKLRDCSDAAKVKELSQDLENWRVSTSLVIHNSYSNDTNFQAYISLVNLNYYYLLIELDQLSASESFQFTLQFLSNSFTLLISEPTSNSKPQVLLSVNSLFWYTKLFNVIKYNISSLYELLLLVCNNHVNKNNTQSDLTLKLTDFNSNLQLMLNLLKYLSQNRLKQHPFISKVNACIDSLGSLNLKLLHFNVFSCPHEDKKSLLEEVDIIRSTLQSSI